MRVNSLGYRTDLIFPAFDGEIRDRGEYMVVRTPSNRAYFWGNFLLFADPPNEGDHLRWPSLFRKEVGGPPQVRHQAFGWDSTALEKGVYPPFLTSGFELVHSHVLSTSKPQPPRRSAMEMTIRPLESRSDWEKAVENQVLCREPQFSARSYRRFRRAQMARYKAMAAKGLGAWYGAFRGDDLVADLGIIANAGLGRYQSVQTHPEFRRKGIGGELVYSAGVHAQTRFGIQTLVIVAEADSPAEGLYRSIGFHFREHQLGLERFPARD